MSRPARQRTRILPSRAGLSVVAGGSTSRTFASSARQVHLRHSRHSLALRPRERAASPPNERLVRLGAALAPHRALFPLPLVAVTLAADGRATPLQWVMGLVLLALGAAVAIAALAAAPARPAMRLTTGGAYAWVRNPQSLAEAAIWLGFALLSGVVWMVPLAAALFALGHAPIVRYEESALEATFGEEYLRYRRRVPRWVPRRPAVALAPSSDWRAALRASRAPLAAGVALVLLFALRALT